MTSAIPVQCSTNWANEPSRTDHFFSPSLSYDMSVVDVQKLYCLHYSFSCSCVQSVLYQLRLTFSQNWLVNGTKTKIFHQHMSKIKSASEPLKALIHYLMNPNMVSLNFLEPFLVDFRSHIWVLFFRFQSNDLRYESLNGVEGFPQTKGNEKNHRQDMTRKSIHIRELLVSRL